MTRPDIGSEVRHVHIVDGHTYVLDERGMICECGRFENQPAYAPYFWNAYLDGTFDEERWDGDVPVVVFAITDDDRYEYPELASATALLMWEGSDGALHTRVDRQV